MKDMNISILHLQTFQNQLRCVEAGAVPAGVRVSDHHLLQPDRHGPGAHSITLFHTV